jgi:retron-type reverse transcriptase
VRGGQWQALRKESQMSEYRVKDIFSFGNIYRCYLACRKNKRNSINALKFEINAEENIVKLEKELKHKTYRPSRSILFATRKPKLREIFAADFRDRVVHHVLVDYLERIWEKIFIHDSYACRKGKGTHKAVMRLRDFLRKISRNGKRKAYYLQLDIKDFFTAIDKDILFGMIKKKVSGKGIVWLTEKIIFWDCTRSFVLRDRERIIKKIPLNKSIFGKENKRGLPIGNLTSQFFANVYLNELDQFAKHNLKVKYYIRYVDDLVLLSEKKEELMRWMDEIERFLESRLKLKLHPRRRKLRTVSNGVDFLGYIIREDYILVRRRVINNMKARLRYFEAALGRKRLQKYAPKILGNLRQSIQSYLGHFRWANSYRLVEKLAEEKVIKQYFAIRNYRLIPKY